MRRLITIPLVLLLTVAATIALPLLVPLAVLLRAIPATRGALPTVLFLVGYLWCETIGVVLAPYNWVRYRRAQTRFQADFRVQCWWANSLKRLAERLFRLHFTLYGQSALSAGPALLICRHTSIADTVLPITYFAKPNQIHLRYVLKRELLLDPCLDIYGHRLPNYFVDRSGQDSAAAIAGVRALTASLSAQEGLLIYPEGTRFSPEKRAAMLSRINLSDDLRAQLQRWPDLLPPRMGGTLAMLEANPGKDLLFMAHTGFEGSSRFSQLINGNWCHAQVRIAFWRVPYVQIPKDPAKRSEFLYAHWDRMQRTVSQLRSL